MNRILIVCVTLLALGSVADAAEQTPTEKVITMLSDLKDEVTKEGEAEAATYGEFKTFCTDTEAAKKEAISSGEVSEQELNATLNDKIGQLSSTNQDIMTQRTERETLEAEKKASRVQCNKDETNYEAQEADLTAGVFGLQSAIERLDAAEKVAQAPALLQAGSFIGANIEHSLKLAEAMGLLKEPKHQAMSAFLQGGTAPWLEEPGKEHNKKDYDFQSGDIVAILNQLLEKFREEKAAAAKNWAETEKHCNTVAKEKAAAIEAKSKSIEGLEQDADRLTTEIGETKEDLLMTQKNLRDDRTYLSELQLNCGNRAADWDQRLKARTGELEAIDTAIGVLTNTVQGLDDAVGRNAGLLATSAKKAAAPAFIQVKSENLLRKGSKSHNKELVVHSLASASASQMKAFNLTIKDDVVNKIAEAGKKLKSARLSMLAVHVRSAGNDLSDGDILTGVKQLVSALLTDLKTEATEEADARGSCTTRLNKANFEKQHRQSQSNKLDSEIKNLETKRIFLSDEINLLEDLLSKLKSELEEATKIRESEAAENKVTIAKSKEGSKAVKDALAALKAFYYGVNKDAAKHDKKMAAKASLAQTSQTPPDAGFSGSYGGKQGASVGILGMMEIIQRDFDKTAADTLAADQKAETEFREFKSASNQDIAAKDTTKTLTEQELESVVNMLKQRKSELERAQMLVDDALQVLEALKPECVDTQESYEVREAQRESEIAALIGALCLLDPYEVEEYCQDE